jgi:hypothetical protein
MKIRYIDGFKYQLAEAYTVQTPIIGVSIRDDYFELDETGLLTILKGYAWDGASGPAFDSKSSMRSSMIHDVFCQAMRDGRLDYSQWQNTVNDIFRQHCIEDGMWPWRAALWHAAVEFADAGNPDQGPDRIVIEAP